MHQAPSPYKERQSGIRDILLASKSNYISTVALSELYRLTLEREGKTVVELRTEALVKDFRLIDVDREIAIGAAIIKHKHRVPFADSLIVATARALRIPCYTDDPHFKSIEGLVVKWVR